MNTVQLLPAFAKLTAGVLISSMKARGIIYMETGEDRIIAQMVTATTRCRLTSISVSEKPSVQVTAIREAREYAHLNSNRIVSVGNYPGHMSFDLGKAHRSASC